eukprot:984627-Pelagomonas_calceolata.AAC.2
MPMFSHTQVEEYLNDVILKMRSELRNILKDSVNAYPTKPRHEWLFDWPSQIILVVNQIFWCQEVEQVSWGSKVLLVAEQGNQGGCPHGLSDLLVPEGGARRCRDHPGFQHPGHHPPKGWLGGREQPGEGAGRPLEIRAALPPALQTFLTHLTTRILRWYSINHAPGFAQVESLSLGFFRPCAHNLPVAALSVRRSRLDCALSELPGVQKVQTSFLLLICECICCHFEGHQIRHAILFLNACTSFLQQRQRQQSASSFFSMRLTKCAVCVCTCAQAFISMGNGDSNAMVKYNEFQIEQLKKLIEEGRALRVCVDQGHSHCSAERTPPKVHVNCCEGPEDHRVVGRKGMLPLLPKVRNMITIDAHSRDMVQGVIESKADKVDCFQWVCQLRSYWDTTINDCRIKICDASFPYGYEYLGNAARLVRGHTHTSTHLFLDWKGEEGVS